MALTIVFPRVSVVAGVRLAIGAPPPRCPSGPRSGCYLRPHRCHPLPPGSPVNDPFVVGVKVTEMVQELVAASEVPHVFVWPKLALAVMLAMLSVALPVLLKVTVWAGLVEVLTFCDVNVNVGGENAGGGSRYPFHPGSPSACFQPFRCYCRLRSSVPGTSAAMVGVNVTLIVQEPLMATLVCRSCSSARNRRSRRCSQSSGPRSRCCSA